MNGSVPTPVFIEYMRQVSVPNAQKCRAFPGKAGEIAKHGHDTTIRSHPEGESVGVTWRLKLGWNWGSQPGIAVKLPRRGDGSVGVAAQCVEHLAAMPLLDGPEHGEWPTRGPMTLEVQPDGRRRP